MPAKTSNPSTDFNPLSTGWVMVVCSLLLFVLSTSAQTTEQYAVMVWDNTQPEVCPLTVEVGPKTRLEVPLDENGVPDKSRATIYGEIAHYKSDCARIELRRRSK